MVEAGHGDVDLALVCCCPSKNIILIYVLSGVCVATEVTS